MTETKTDNVEENNSTRIQTASSRKEKALRMLKDQKTIHDVCDALDVSEATVNKYIDQLVEEGRIERDEIVRVTPGQREATDAFRANPQYKTEKSSLLAYLKLGWSPGAIRKELNLGPLAYRRYILDLKRERLITSSQIQEKKDEKRQNDLDALEKHIHDYGTIEQYKGMRPELSKKDVESLKQELLDTGRITSDEIKRNAQKAMAETKAEKLPLSPKDQERFVLEKLREDHLGQEIADADETNTLSVSTVYKIRKRLIARGDYSEDENRETKSKRMKQRFAPKKKERIEAILRYTQEGYDLIEIAQKIGCAYETVLNAKGDYEKENKWFTPEELNEFKRQREEREKRELQEAKDEIERANAEIIRQQKELDEQRAEIARQQKELEDQKAEIVRQQRELNRQRAIFEREQAMQTTKARNTQGKGGRPKKVVDNVTVQSLRRKLVGNELIVKTEEYMRLKKSAELEDKQEYDGDASVSISGRTEFADFLIKLYQLECVIARDDMELVYNTIYLHHDFAKPKYLKLLIANANRTGGAKRAEEMATELMDCLRETKYRRPLFEYRKWIQSQQKLVRIRTLKNEGKNNEQIAEIIGISSAEVVVLLRNAGKKMDFFKGIDEK